MFKKVCCIISCCKRQPDDENIVKKDERSKEENVIVEKSHEDKTQEEEKTHEEENVIEDKTHEEENVIVIVDKTNEEENVIVNEVHEEENLIVICDDQNEHYESISLSLELKNGIIKNVLEYHKTTYAEFYSIREKPIKTNFNDELFINLCFNFDFKSKDDLFCMLEKYNEEQKINVEKQKGLSEKRLKKCQKSDFFLFI
jgi:hypothetical protein